MAGFSEIRPIVDNSTNSLASSESGTATTLTNVSSALFTGPSSLRSIVSAVVAPSFAFCVASRVGRPIGLAEAGGHGRLVAGCGILTPACCDGPSLPWGPTRPWAAVRRSRGCSLLANVQRIAGHKDGTTTINTHGALFDDDVFRVRHDRIR